jgi:O-antigen ligase/Tfp pilus assembly protein PilF
MPRSRLEIPILLLLAAFAAATASALNVGVSLSAMAAIVGTTCMLPAALLVLRHRPALTALAVCVPILILAAITLPDLVGRRVAWYVAGGPGLLPPIRLPAESTPFGSVAVAPFALLAIAPLTLVIGHAALRRVLQAAIVTLGVPLAVLSGSRSAWLAIGVAAIAFAAPAVMARRQQLGDWIGDLRRGAWTARNLVLAAAGLAVLVVAAVVAAPRVTAVTSLIYRGNLWRDTLAAWSSDPLLGVGPGIMPWARQAAAAPLSFPVRQPHSHDIPIGILGDAGLLGLAAAAVLVVAFARVAGPWRSRTPGGRAAAAVLTGFAVAGLFEDLTFIPGINLLAILLAALGLADAGAIDWRPIEPAAGWLARTRWLPAATVGAALVVPMVVADAAAVAYRRGTDAAARDDWPAATTWLLHATTLDPWQPTAPKALAVAAAAAGDEALAHRSAERAVELNPGDGPSWANLAVLCRAAANEDCAVEAAANAQARATFYGLELVNAALVFESLGDAARADEAYGLSLLTNPLTSLAVPWPRRVAVDPGGIGELDRQATEFNVVIASAVQGAPIDSGRIRDPAVRALAEAIAGDEETARQALERAMLDAPASVLTWEVAVALATAWGESIERPAAIVEVVTGSPLPAKDVRTGLSSLTFDIATFRAYPIDGIVPRGEHMTGAQTFPWNLVALIHEAAALPGP